MSLKLYTLNLVDETMKKIKKNLDRSNADSLSRFTREAIKEKLEREEKKK